MLVTYLDAGNFPRKVDIYHASINTHFTPLSLDVCEQDRSWYVAPGADTTQFHDQYMQHLRVVTPLSSNHLKLLRLPQSVLAGSSKLQASRLAYSTL